MKTEFPEMEGPVCAVPLPHQDQVVIGHGSGGRLSQELINRIFLPPFMNPSLSAGDDAGVIALPSITGIRSPVAGRLAISIDSHVVWPLFFSGGDIGRLAVCGTVNDVAMMGAEPLYLTAGFILEEGLQIHLLEKIVESMRVAAKEAGVQIIAGDTKVVQRGKADGLYISTTGVGIIPPGVEIGGALAKPGDSVILSGTIGDHGIAVLEARGELGFASNIQSDVSPLNHLVSEMRNVSRNIHVMRDPTRGGLATTLNEIACQSQVCIQIKEAEIPVKPAVASACEMLGFDPIYIANEGKLVAIVAKEDEHAILQVMKSNRFGEEARIIGEVLKEPKGRMLMKTTLGSTRVVDMPSGEILPRIC